MTQNERILRHLKVAPITALEALQYAGVMRLGARIWDLRQAGHRIEGTMIEKKNRRGETVHVKQYRLVK